MLAGCSMIGLPSSIDSTTAAVPRVFHFAEGGDAAYYVLDKRLAPLRKEAAAPAMTQGQSAAADRIDTYVFFISGSGCTSLRHFLPRYFDGLEGESGPIRIFMLQKRFIAPDTWGRTFGCSRAFIEADHPSRWLADQADFIAAQLDRAAASGRSPARIVIAGISEGAEIVPLLARLIPGVTHVVMIGNGGMPPMQAYRLHLAAQDLEMPAALSRSFGTGNVQPEFSGDDLIAGHTRRYWSELEWLDPARELLALSIPVWVAMGELDTAVPVASAHYLASQFAQHGKTNLVLKIYAGADHGLATNSRINTPDFWFEFDRSMQK